jgi:hypothetical protein
MYKEKKAVLFSRVSYPDLLESRFLLLPTNGTYVRGFRGHNFGRYGAEDRGILYVAECEGRSFRGNITDPILCQRIREYFTTLRGRRYTNCAAMAHFLTTGQFVECVEDERMAIIHQGMRPYDMANRIDVGDMVGIIYGRQRIANSRRYPELRARFRKAQRLRSQTGTFTSYIPMARNSFTPEVIREMCECVSVVDFHFMVCVDHCHGKPVWISQYGRMPPGSNHIAVVLTLGEYDPYQQHTPMFSLIKKRR